MTASPLGSSNLCNLLEKRLVTASHLSLSYPMGSLASFLNNNNIEDYKNLEIEELIKNSMHYGLKVPSSSIPQATVKDPRTFQNPGPISIRCWKLGKIKSLI